MSRDGRARWGILQSFLIGRQGNPMMKRLRVIQTPWFGIYLHSIYREDLDPVPHDHPWNFWRLVLRGGYLEDYWTDPSMYRSARTQRIGKWRPCRVPTAHAHRILSVRPGTLSLVVVGRKQRVWGFWQPHYVGIGVDPESDLYGQLVANGREWIDYRDALSLRPNEGVTP